MDSPLEQSGFELWVPPACDAPGQPKGSLLTPCLREPDSNLSVLFAWIGEFRVSVA